MTKWLLNLITTATPLLAINAIYIALLIGCSGDHIEHTHTIHQRTGTQIDSYKVPKDFLKDKVSQSPNKDSIAHKSIFREPFSSLSSSTFTQAKWRKDTFPNDGPFSDQGAYFSEKSIVSPPGYRSQITFGEHEWLTAELYTKDNRQSIHEMIKVIADPDNPSNQVIRLRSLKHTDAIIVRSTHALPTQYRISLKVGFADFGDGTYSNGYDSGDEQAGPWLPHNTASKTGSAVGENGFYWLAILDQTPRPHNNIWIHHHRKFVIDSDNNFPAWTQIFDGTQFITSGTNPVSIFTLDGKSKAHIHNGKPFIMYANGSWQPTGKIRAVDAYLPKEWYEVTFTRANGKYEFSVSGKFKFGGVTKYQGKIDYKSNCLYHYNQDAIELEKACVDTGFFPELGNQFPHWPADSAYADHFMFGDPHINFYEGSILYDDLTLEHL